MRKTPWKLRKNRLKFRLPLLRSQLRFEQVASTMMAEEGLGELRRIRPYSGHRRTPDSPIGLDRADSQNSQFFLLFFYIYLIITQQQRQ